MRRSYSTEPFYESDNEDSYVTDIGRHRCQDGENDTNEHGNPNDPLCRILFSYHRPWNLSQEVDPEVCGQHQSLNRLGPSEWSVLCANKI